MEQTKFLKVIIFILLVINIGTITFMWINRPPHHFPPHRELGDFLMKELDFSLEQRKQFDKLRDEHRALAAPWRRRNVELHEEFYAMVSHEPVDSILINQLSDSIADVQKKIEVSMFYHFQKVRTLCNKEQEEKFNEVIRGAIKLISPPPLPPPKKIK